MEKNHSKKLTTIAGKPFFEHENSLSAGERGPLLLQDYILHEKMAHFNRERIPERVVHAKGSGAFGTFRITHDISTFSKAKIFNKIGNACRIFVRFSTVGGEKGSPDAERDPRGFAIKFYTEDGNWDLVGNNTPVFFIKDPKKFSDFIHTQKRDPQTNLKSPTMMWDYWSLHPESLHQLIILMSDRGIPASYRHMNGYGSHTFSLINIKNERFWVKFHLKTVQGIQNLTTEEATQIKANDPDHAQRDLVNAILNHEFPKWYLKIQIMDEAQAIDFKWNPFDMTKIWPHAEFPLIDVGELELNELPKNYFADVEQAAFAPTNLIDGIGFSPDKMLQGRILSYPDAQRYRLGTNYFQTPVNQCPFQTNTLHRDGKMCVNGNGGNDVNYYPNSLDTLHLDSHYKEPSIALESQTANWFDRNGKNDDDHYTQPGELYRNVMNEKEKQRTIKNIIQSMMGISGPMKERIINMQLCYFFRADIGLGMAIAKGLGVNLDDAMSQH